MHAKAAEVQEEIVVIFHAALLGRTDVLKNAITSIRSSGNYSEDEVRRLISTSRADDGATPLHIAAQYGHTDVIRALLNAGANVSFCPKTGDFAGKRPYDISKDSAQATFHVFFFEQIAMGHIEAMEALLRGGIPLTLIDESPSGDSALHWAASFGHVNLVQSLLSHGFPIDLVNHDGMTALHIAVKSKALEVVKVLLEEGASVDVLDDKHHTARDLISLVTAEGSSIQNALIALFEDPPEVTKRCHQRYMESLLTESLRVQEETCLSSVSLDMLEGDTANNNENQPATNVAMKVTPSDAPQINNKSLKMNDVVDDFSMAYSSTVVYEAEDDYEQEEDDISDKNGDEKEGDEDEEDVLLVFWPPVFRQKRRKNAIKHGLHLYVEENLVIGVIEPHRSGLHPEDKDIELTSQMLFLVSDSGLYKILDETFGFQVQVKRLSATHASSHSLTLVDPLLLAHPLDHHTTHNMNTTSIKDNNTINNSPRDHIVGAQIILQLDTHRCPLPQSYFLYVTRKHVKIVAHDLAGLLYACYTLIQLIQLHSQRPTLQQQQQQNQPFFANLLPNGNRDRSSKNLGLIIPAMVLEDRPTTAAVRAVTWPYRPGSQLLTHLTCLQSQILLFAQLRLNRVYLLLDPQEGLDSQAHTETIHSSEETKRTTHETDTWRAIRVLDTLCRKLQIELVPTVVLTYPSQRLPSQLLYYFSQTLIHLVFLPHQPETIVGIETISEYQMWYSLLLVQCQQAAFRSVQCSYSSFMRHCVVHRTGNIHGSAQKTQNALEIPRGLSVWETSLAAFAPSALHDKPFLAQEMYLSAIAKHVQTVEESGDAMMVLPLFSERDFLYPIFFQKFHALYFAGLAWQRATACDMLGDPNISLANNTDISSYDGTVLREVLRWLLYPALFHPFTNNRQDTNNTHDNRNNYNSNKMNSSHKLSYGNRHIHISPPTNQQLQTTKRSASFLMQHLLLQPWCTLYQHTLQSNTTNNTNLTMYKPVVGVTGTSSSEVSKEDMYEAEMGLWRLIHLSSHYRDDDHVAVTKTQASLALKCYRRTLALVQWRPNSLVNTSSMNIISGTNNSNNIANVAHSNINNSYNNNANVSPATATANVAGPLSFLEFFLGRSTNTTSSTTTSQTLSSATNADHRHSDNSSGTNITDKDMDIHNKIGNNMVPQEQQQSKYHINDQVVTLLDATEQLSFPSALYILMEEIDEVFALLHLLSIVSKLLLQTDHAFKQQHVANNTATNSNNSSSSSNTLRAQFQALSVSSRSDVANMLLEALYACHVHVSGRFNRSMLLPVLKETCLATLPVLNKYYRKEIFSTYDITDNAENQSNVGNNTTNHSINIDGNVSLRRRAFLLPPQEGGYAVQLPALLIFKLLCEGLVLPKTVEEFLLRIFQ